MSTTAKGSVSLQLQTAKKPVRAGKKIMKAKAGKT